MPEKVDPDGASAIAGEVGVCENDHVAFGKLADIVPAIAAPLRTVDGDVSDAATATAETDRIGAGSGWRTSEMGGPRLQRTVGDGEAVVAVGDEQAQSRRAYRGRLPSAEAVIDIPAGEDEKLQAGDERFVDSVPENGWPDRTRSRDVVAEAELVPTAKVSGAEAVRASASVTRMVTVAVDPVTPAALTCPAEARVMPVGSEPAVRSKA